jgi:hypothetical protein
MVVLTLLLWLVALLALAVAVLFYRWARVSRGWRIFHLIVAAPVVVIAALFSVVIGVLGPPFFLLVVSAVLFASAWNYKVGLFMARLTDKRLSGGKEIFTLFYDAPTKEGRRSPPDETHNG